MTTDNAELIEQLQKESFLTRLVCTEIADQVADLIDRAIAALTAQGVPVLHQYRRRDSGWGECSAQRVDELKSDDRVETRTLYAHPQPAEPQQDTGYATAMTPAEMAKANRKLRGGDKTSPVEVEPSQLLPFVPVPQIFIDLADKIVYEFSKQEEEQLNPIKIRTIVDVTVARCCALQSVAVEPAHPSPNTDGWVSCAERLPVTFRSDGAWIHFSSSRGQEAAVSLENLATRQGPIVRAAMLGWASDKDGRQRFVLDGEVKIAAAPEAK